MIAKWFWRGLFLVLAILVIGVLVEQNDVVTEPKVPKGWSFSIPDGDAEVGGANFMKMKCYSCHVMKVPGEKLPTDMGNIGPAFTIGYSNLPKEYLAESIIKVHKLVADPNFKMKQGGAGIGNYNHFLTIRELTDLVAYLKYRPQVALK